MNYYDLDSPALLINKAVLVENISRMQSHIDSHSLKLRPHIKTHKMPALARRQMQAGAVGIACAKVSEALVMAENGFSDIQIPNIIIGSHKMQQLLKLNDITDRLSVTVDSREAARQLSEAFSAAGQVIDVLQIVDCGYQRCGLGSYDEILDLCKYMSDLPALNFCGITTHAGQAYGAASPAELKEIGLYEGRFMVSLARHLSDNGYECKEVVAGSNPTALYTSTVPGITCIRTGNYIFNDMIQVGLGTVDIDRCALTVLATVISTPSPTRAILDTGSKSLSSDRGGHGNESVSGFGYIVEKGISITRLSEEHGIIEHCNECTFTVGEKLRIIPNHACTAVNLHREAYLVSGNEVVDTYDIAARAMLR